MNVVAQCLVLRQPLDRLGIGITTTVRYEKPQAQRVIALLMPHPCTFGEMWHN